IDFSEFPVFLKNLAKLLPIKFIGKMKIDKTRSGNFNTIDQRRIKKKTVNNLLRKLTGIGLRRFGNNHRNIRCYVTMFRIARFLKCRNGRKKNGGIESCKRLCDALK